MAPPSQKLNVPPFTNGFLLFRYLGSSTLTDQNRALSGKNFVSPFEYKGNFINRHEVPYASTMEGGAGAFSQLTSASQNREHGVALNSFYKRNNLKAGDYFLVPLETGGYRNPQSSYSPARKPYSNPLPYLLPIGQGVEETEALDIATEILEGLLLL